MKKQDGRHLKADSRKLVRLNAITLWQQGHTRVYIARALGVHHVTIGHWIKVYRSQGMDGLQLKKRGRPYGACRTLNRRQEATILKTILLKTPEQLKLPSMLWTRRIIQTFIRERYQITIPIRSIGEYMKRWGIMPGKPVVKEAHEYPAAVQNWLQTEYLAIQERAKSENAEIYWSIRSHPSAQQNAAIHLPAAVEDSPHSSHTPSHALNLMCAVSNQGTARFMGFAGEPSAGIFLDFARRLQQSSTRKLYLITDNAAAGQHRLVKTWQEKYAREIEIFLLPGYSAVEN